MIILACDTETSGLPGAKEVNEINIHLWPYILQLSYVLYDTSTAEIVSYLDHYISIPSSVVVHPGAFQVHGITTEMMTTDGIDIKDALNTLNEAMTEADVVIGHNVQFDCKMIVAECLRNQVTLQIDSSKIECTMLEGTPLCKITKAGSKGYKWPTLLELHRHLFKKDPENLHDSLIDVVVCLRCYLQMKGITCNDDELERIVSSKVKIDTIV